MRYLKKAKTTYNLISIQFRVMIYSHLKIPCLRQSGQRERENTIIMAPQGRIQRWDGWRLIPPTAADPMEPL
jgi:hypothetical protein